MKSYEGISSALVDVVHGVGVRDVTETLQKLGHI